MSRKQFAVQLKTFKISEIQQGLVDAMLASGTFATEAEIYRQGVHLVSMFHHYPQEFFELINKYAQTKN